MVRWGAVPPQRLGVGWSGDPAHPHGATDRNGRRHRGDADADTVTRDRARGATSQHRWPSCEEATPRRGGPAHSAHGPSGPGKVFSALDSPFIRTGGPHPGGKSPELGAFVILARKAWHADATKRRKAIDRVVRVLAGMGEKTPAISEPSCSTFARLPYGRTRRSEARQGTARHSKAQQGTARRSGACQVVHSRGEPQPNDPAAGRPVAAPSRPGE